MGGGGCNLNWWFLKFGVRFRGNIAVGLCLVSLPEISDRGCFCYIANFCYVANFRAFVLLIGVLLRWRWRNVADRGKPKYLDRSLWQGPLLALKDTWPCLPSKPGLWHIIPATNDLIREYLNVIFLSVGLRPDSGPWPALSVIYVHTR